MNPTIKAVQKSHKKLFSEISKHLGLAIELMHGIPRDCVPTREVVEKVEEFRNMIGANGKNASKSSKLLAFLRSKPEGATIKEMAEFLRQSDAAIYARTKRMGLKLVKQRYTGAKPLNVYGV